MKENDDYLGGVVIFVAMFTIAFIELHVLKNLKAFKAASSKGGNGASLSERLWTAIGDTSPGRFEKRGVVTVTGTVVGKEPHYNRDGDMVFGLAPDEEYEHLLTPANDTYTIAGGGLWCEAVCQRPNTSPEAVHKDDCKRGGPYPTFPMPGMGERWSVTGLHIIDIREGGHAEIHPITRMSKI